jgi:ribosomal protein S18 acetylase RimI-like enzyme
MRVSLISDEQQESMVDLLCELHRFYNAESTVPREVVRAHLIENLLAAESPLRLVVASHDGRKVIGFAAIALLYSLVEPTAEKRRQCVLKELYVCADQRSRGVGRALVSWVARHAVESGCCRIDWPVNVSNDRGIAFYESLGAKQVVERLSYRLSEPSMSRLALESSNGSKMANMKLNRDAKGSR